jgi:hypothetical protein
MVSKAGSSFPRITGFAFRFQTKLCPGCGCGRRRPNDRLWGCDPGTLASDVLLGLELVEAYLSKRRAKQRHIPRRRTQNVVYLQLIRTINQILTLFQNWNFLPGSTQKECKIAKAQIR